MSQVQDSIAAGRTRRNPRKPALLTSDMIVAYVFSVIEECIISIYIWRSRSAQNQRCGRMSCWKMKSLYKNDTRKLSELPKGKKAISKCVFAKKT